MIGKIKGPKMKNIFSDESKVVHPFKADNFNSWGVIPSQSGVLLCVEDGSLSVVADFKIIGCLFKRNIGLDDFQESVCLLMEDLENETKLVLCMRLQDYQKFDQAEVEKLVMNCSQYKHCISSDLFYPITPENLTGMNLSAYINDILEWTKSPYVRMFSVGKKGEIGPGHLPEELNEDKAQELFNNLLTEYRDITLFEGKVFTVQTNRCKLGPDDYKCRVFDRKYCEVLKGSLMGHSSLALEKKIVYLVPIMWDPREERSNPSYKGSPFKTMPSIEDLNTCCFWIVGGQHTIEAYKMLIDDPKFDPMKKEALKTVSASLFWTPFNLVGNTKIMGLSQALNNMNKTTMPESQFLLMAKQVRSIWISAGRPTPTRGQSAGSMWKVLSNLIWESLACE